MTPSIFNSRLAGHALLGDLLEDLDCDPGDVLEDGRPCRDVHLLWPAPPGGPQLSAKNAPVT